MLCPFPIGRDREYKVVRSALEARVGTAVLVSGEAGIGKSRFARDAAEFAAAQGMPAVWARGSAATITVPFRPATELVGAAVRRLGDVASLPSLAPYRRALARLNPAVGDAPGPESSAAVLAESVLHLLAAVAERHGGLLVVVEDLHWVDPDSLGVFEYIAANLEPAPLVLLGTLRSDEESSAGRLARRLHRNRTAALLELRRLTSAEVAEMVRGCMGLPPEAVLPADRAARVAPAEGLPLLVEDLLATDEPDEAGTLRVFADTVRERLHRLDWRHVAVLDAAAVFGQSFPWELLAEIAAVDEPTVLEALRAAADVGLLVTVGDGFEFRHALTAAAVLDRVLPPQRAMLSGRAAQGVIAAHPDLPGAWCVMAGELLHDAGDVLGASRLWHQAGRRALNDGAIGGAIRLLERAVGSAGADPILEHECRVTLLEATALSGDAGRAEDLGRMVLAHTDAHGRSRLHLMLARAHLGTGLATEHLVAARETAPDALALAEVDALEALVVLDSGGVDAQVTAARLAERAVSIAVGAGRYDVACEALEVIGRAARPHDLDTAEAAFARELGLAEEGGEVLWRIRALNEVGTIAWLRAGDPTGVLRAQVEALESGALLLAAGYSINLVFFDAFRGRLDAARETARECAQTARRLGAASLAETAVVFEAMVEALAGDRPAMERLLAQVSSAPTGDLVVLVEGLCRPVLSLLEEDRAAALEAFTRADEEYRSHPPLMGDPFTWLWLLVRLVDGAATAADLADLERHAPGTLLHRWSTALCTAVVEGRAGRTEEPRDRRDEVVASMTEFPVLRHLCIRLVAEAGVRDGWGVPAAPLAESEAWFLAHGHQRAAAACRRLLRDAGVTIGRGGAQEVAVPPRLRGLGVTAREAEVLALLTEPMSNREIADLLCLSPRTVEKHVASLLKKMGVAKRGDLTRA